MSNFTEMQCVGCALSGYYTALAIENVLPVLHAGAGCALNASQLLGINNGSQQGVGYNENMLPCTNLIETDVVFGGINKLRNVMEKSLEYFKPDMVIAMSGCVSGIIGDNLNEIADGFSDRDIPVLTAETSGFIGDNIYGHEQVLTSIINGYLKPVGKINPKQVNVWGLIPYYDTFWSGNYEAVESLLADLGLSPNIIYGVGHGIKNIDKIPAAALNLVISPWWDLNTAKLLEEKFGTPYLHYPVLPIGPAETTKFINTLTEHTGIDRNIADKIIKKGEQKYYYHIERGVAMFNEGKKFIKRFNSISTSLYALSAAKFLVNDLGLIPEKQYIVDSVPEIYRQKILDEYNTFEGGFSPEVEFTLDVGKAHQELLREAEALKKANIPLKRKFIIGSSWDDIPAAEIGANLFEISCPANDRVVLDRNYFGYSGGLRFFEDLYDKALTLQVS